MASLVPMIAFALASGPPVEPCVHSEIPDAVSSDHLSSPQVCSVCPVSPVFAEDA